MSAMCASNAQQQADEEQKKTQSDSGLITLGKRLNPKATKSASG